jgi:acyl dehydratase
METNAEKHVQIFQQHVGTEDPPGEWFTIDQERINQFADCTVDHQFVHVDPEKSAKLSPYKVTIAHGFLTLSMLSHLSVSVKAAGPRDAYSGLAMVVNYGFEKVRFPAAVKVNSRIRLRRILSSAELKNPNTIQIVYTCTIEIDGESKPGCVADWILHFMYT